MTQDKPSRRRKRKTPQSKLNYQKRRRATLARKGLCLQCGKRPAKPGYTLCTEHLTNHATAVKKADLAKRVAAAGITLEDYHQRLQATNGTCQIPRCHRPATKFNFTGDRLRAILCEGCDTAVKALEDPATNFGPAMLNFNRLNGLLTFMVIDEVNLTPQEFKKEMFEAIRWRAESVTV